MNPLWKKPSAWVPMVLSFGILAMELGFLLFSGPPQRQPDEGVAAHLFQLWLLAEFFLVALFAVRWMPQGPKQALSILAIQIALVLAGMFPVFYFHL
mgnify:CR=1 FL=1